MPGARLVVASADRQRSTWRRRSLLAAGPGFDDELPAGAARARARSRSRVDVAARQQRRSASCATGRPGRCRSWCRCAATGFPVASPAEQDGLRRRVGRRARAARPGALPGRAGDVAGVGAPGRRRRSSPSSSPRAGRATRPRGGERRLRRRCSTAGRPFTIAHDVLLTVTVDLRRVRGRRGASAFDVGDRRAGRRDPPAGQPARDGGLRRRTAAVAGGAVDRDPGAVRPDPCQQSARCAARWPRRPGRAVAEWGPMAVEPDWFEARVDGVVASIVPRRRLADAAGRRRLDGPAADRRRRDPHRHGRAGTGPARGRGADANRQLTSIEADHAQKERHGFRLTARSGAATPTSRPASANSPKGIPSSATSASSPSPPPTSTQLDDACRRVEQAAAQSLLDLRPLAARQAEGWVASLPLGRSVRQGAWQ